MDSERWQQVRRILTEAIEFDIARRSTFLDKICAGDPELRAEVDSLLASHEQAGDLLEKPAFQAVPELFREACLKSPIGQKLGSYLVIEELGRGGMGVVYLAEDVTLGRRVAMKALSPQFTGHEQHRERLRREARAAAALAHPGAATVYALEEFEGVLYIICEYVPGETLRAELERGPMATKSLLDTGLELARTVAAAHTQGIIHRDLKPENVIRTADGRIKILDFGLAQIAAPEGTDISTKERLTQAGTFLGTPSYASPEQLRGQKVDAGTDVFSLGVMLYEMASGIHPFGGTNSISTIARILEKEPIELSLIHTASPPGLNGIIRKCLNKKPSDRYASAQDLVADLERIDPKLSNRPAAGTSPLRPNNAGEPLWWWQFHQVIAGLGCYLMLYPLWKVREWMSSGWGATVFFVSLIAVGISANLRFHLWFTSRFYPRQLAAQRRRVGYWIRSGDLVFALLLVMAASAIYSRHAFWAALHLGAAIVGMVSLFAIEPATTRAAFENFGAELETSTK